MANIKTNWIDIARYQGVLTDAQWNDVKKKCEGVVMLRPED